MQGPIIKLIAPIVKFVITLKQILFFMHLDLIVFAFRVIFTIDKLSFIQILDILGGPEGPQGPEGPPVRVPCAPPVRVQLQTPLHTLLAA